LNFHITDDLPDLGNQVLREEILILLTVAPSLSPFFAEAIEAASESTREEVPGHASRPIRPRQHAETG
jgi:hypothetical protein